MIIGLFSGRQTGYNLDAGSEEELLRLFAKNHKFLQVKLE
jgi:hypothetical protein